MKTYIVRDWEKEKVPSGANKVSLKDCNNIDPSSCTDLFVGDCLDFVDERQKLFEIILSKIRYGGQITITGLDLVDVGRGLFLGQITPVEANNILYKGRVSGDTMRGIIEALQHYKFEIVQQRCHNLYYTVTAVRPKPEL